MKLYLYCSLFALLFLVSCRSDKVYSEWSLQNRESGEYLGEKQGSFCFAAEPSGDEYLWIIESTSGEEFLIKNKKSGNYLQLDGKGAVCAAPGGQETENMKWKYGGFDFVTQKNCGWYTLENGAAETERHLARRADGIVMDDSDRVKDYRSHWNIVRETGTELSFVLTPDKVTDASFLGTREAVAVSDTEIESDYHGKDRWKLQKDISAFPRFTAENNRLLAALYNMALEEMLLDIRTDSTFMAGALWPDTWTRDAVYSIYFSYAWILPEVSRKTLEKQTFSYVFKSEDIGIVNKTHSFYTFIPGIDYKIAAHLSAIDQSNELIRERQIDNILPEQNKIIRYKGRLYSHSESDDTFQISIFNNGEWGEEKEEELPE